MSESPRVVAVVLAAGAGTRFAGPGHKLDADLGGRSVLVRALEHALAAAIGSVVVVVAAEGAHPLPVGATEVVNPRWADGQATSLWAGIEAAVALGADAVVVGLGDQPGIEPSAWRAVAMADAPIAIATYEGSPAILSVCADVWPRLPERVMPELGPWCEDTRNS